MPTHHPRTPAGRHRATPPARSGVARRLALSAGTLTVLGVGGTLAARTLLDRPSQPTTTPAAPAPANPPASSPDPTTAATTSSPSPSPTPRTAGWTLEEMVGQLLMVGVPAQSAPGTSTGLLTAHHIGGVFLSGRSSAGATVTRSLVDSLVAAGSSAHGTGLLVSTDQEGGNVQVLSGPGISTLPDALTQSGWDTATLTTSATTWARELASAGVTVNLAPCADLVDLPDPTANSPIGHWKRELGHDAATVSSHVAAFCAGMRTGGVLPTVKHFPGLGRVRDNTDTTAHVTDTVTTVQDVTTGPFATAVADGAEIVMVASATYSQIDPSAPAVFSPALVTDLLRGQLGFTGVVVTDDVAAAVQVSAWTPAQRAVKAVRAGCDLVLAAADASVTPAMAAALVAEAQADPAFAEQVRASAERVLVLKERSATLRA